MTLLSRKGLLAISAVVDIALHARNGPVAAKALAARHGLPPRHLEPVLQALVRQGILRGVRGPRGGYELARDRQYITAADVLRAADTVDANGGPMVPKSPMLIDIIIPAVAKAERVFAAALLEITIEALAHAAAAHPNSA